jgi:predicted AAA+ superfamily ATPase
MYQTVRHLLAQNIAPDRLWWLRLDHPLLMDFSLDALVGGIAETTRPDHPVFLFLDELAYAEKWDLWLKTFYDEQWPVRLMASSSSTAVLRGRRMESGVGRWEEQYLSPYLFGEYLDLCGKTVDVPDQPTLAEAVEACIDNKVRAAGLESYRRRFVLTGGFPELLTQSAQPIDEESALLQSQRTLRSDAVERAIYKDIPQAFGVDNPLALERLLYVLAGQVTGLISPRTVCASVGNISLPTLERYLSYLEQSFLVFTLPNYSGSEETVQRRGRRVYFVDSAIRNAALQRGLAPLTDPTEMGLLLENLAAGHLHALCEQTQVRLYHWRRKRSEVDLVYDHPQFPLAFEIAQSPMHSRKWLVEFEQQFPRYRGRCYLVAPTAGVSGPAENADGIGRLPLDLFLLVVSAQSRRALAERLAA